MEISSEPLSQFERDVMVAILATLSPEYAPLLEQIAAAKVYKREKSDRGFYTYFLLPKAVRTIDSKEKMQFGGVFAEINGLQYGMGFVLYVVNGVIDCLEGYSFDEDWVEPLLKYKVKRENSQNFH